MDLTTMKIVEKWDIIIYNNHSRKDIDNTEMKSFLSTFDIDICQIAKSVKIDKHVTIDDIETSFMEYVKCIISRFSDSDTHIPNAVLLKIKNLAISPNYPDRLSYSYIYGKKWNPLAICKLTSAKFVCPDNESDIWKYKKSHERAQKYRKRGFNIDEKSLTSYIDMCDDRIKNSFKKDS